MTPQPLALFRCGVARQHLHVARVRTRAVHALPRATDGGFKAGSAPPLSEALFRARCEAGTGLQGADSVLDSKRILYLFSVVRGTHTKRGTALRMKYQRSRLVLGETTSSESLKFDSRWHFLSVVRLARWSVRASCSRLRIEAEILVRNDTSLWHSPNGNTKTFVSFRTRICS